MLSNVKLRHFIDRETLKSIYHAIFEPHLYYSSLVWAQNSSSIEKTICFAKKSLRIIYFLNHNPHASPLFRELNVLKLPDKNALENRLFINVSTNVYAQSLKIGLLSRLIFIPAILVGPI